MDIPMEGIASIIGAMGGFELVKWLARSYLERHKKQAEAAKMEDENERRQTAWLEKRIEQRDLKIDSVYAELRRAEDEKLQILHEKYRLELELKEANYNKCMVYDCGKRKPPRGSVFPSGFALEGYVELPKKEEDEKEND